VAGAAPVRIKIVRKPKGQIGFAVHARRWVVERSFAWIGRNRRLMQAVIHAADLQDRDGGCC
jgi:putative transposase